jgi:hypothetical protein
MIYINKTQLKSWFTTGSGTKQPQFLKPCLIVPVLTVVTLLLTANAQGNFSTDQDTNLGTAQNTVTVTVNGNLNATGMISGLPLSPGPGLQSVVMEELINVPASGLTVEQWLANDGSYVYDYTEYDVTVKLNLDTVKESWYFLLVSVDTEGTVIQNRKPTLTGSDFNTTTMIIPTDTIIAGQKHEMAKHHTRFAEFFWIVPNSNSLPDSMQFDFDHCAPTRINIYGVLRKK